MRLHAAPWLALFLLAACAPTTSEPGTSSPPASAATLILRDGVIWTGDDAAPQAQALAVLGDRIVAIGSTADVMRLSGAKSRVIDLRGRLVVPGFIDSHVHFLSGGDEIMAPDLRSARSADEMGARLGASAHDLPERTWLTSGSWDHENWPGAALPTRTVLDRHTPKHPVFVSRLDGHMAVANSLAISIAGVTKDTPDPSGGTIVRDPKTGEPAGVFKDAAMDLISRHIPDWTSEQRFARARAALAHAASLGVTGVHDMGPADETLDVYRLLRDRGDLTVRITAYLPIGSSSREEARRLRADQGDGAFLRINGVKAFADGSLGSTTALFFDPYSDAPETRGLAQTDLSPAGSLEQQIRAFRAAGLQPAIHAIGDQANRLILDIYERTRTSSTSRPTSSSVSPLPCRIEHAQHLTPSDIARFHALNVVASMQPYHAIDDGRWCEKRIGATRSATTYAFRSLLDAKATLIFGSDWPVAPLSPLLGIYAATTRRTLDDRNPSGWVPAQKISVTEALRAYTLAPASASGATSLGPLAPNRVADIVVLSRNLLTIDPAAIKDVAVDFTIVNGRVVYESSAR